MSSKEKIEFFPIGSVIILKGNVRKMVIVARCVMTEVNGVLNFFDYAGALYPEGMMGPQLMYFNHKDILKLVHKGYYDEDEAMMVDNLNEWIDKTDVKRGNPYELNVQNMSKQMKDGE